MGVEGQQTLQEEPLLPIPSSQTDAVQQLKLHGRQHCVNTTDNGHVGSQRREINVAPTGVIVWRIAS